MGAILSIAIVFVSKTGNTRLLAERARILVPADSLVYFGAPSPEALQASTVLMGFWTDKGTCPEPDRGFLRSCHGKRVFLFATYGYGGDPTYADHVLGNACGLLPEDAEYLGGYACLGKMPATTRERFVRMAVSAPDRFLPKIANFDNALTHPDEADLHGFDVALCRAIATP